MICPGPSAFDSQLSRSALLSIERELSRPTIYQACSTSADFLWLRGLIARQLGENISASNWFESSLLQHPQRAGVLLDFATTKEALGDILSAAEIYRNLLNEHEPTDELRALITNRLSATEAMLKSDSYKNAHSGIYRDTRLPNSSMVLSTISKAVLVGQIGVSYGYDSNLNSAPSTRAFNLLIEDRLLSIDIAEADQRKAGHFQTLFSRLGQQGVFEGGRWGINMRQSLRTAEDSRLSAGALELGAEAGYSLANLGSLSGQVQGFFGKQWVAIDRTLTTRSDRLSVSYEFDRMLKIGGGGGSFVVVKEMELRRFPGRSILDGNLLFNGVRMSCRSNDTSFEIFSRSGIDKRLDFSRAGGDQSKKELGILWVKQYSRQLIRLHWFSSKSDDEIGYNLLIDNNKIRSTERINRGIEWAYKPTGSRFETFLAYEKTDQRSSVSLFSLTGSQLSGGVRTNF